MTTQKQRREAARRKLERQLMARQERARRRRQANVVASVVGALVVVAVVIVFVVVTNNEKSTPSASGTTPPATTPSASPSATATTPVAATKPYPCVFTKSGTAAKKATVPTLAKAPRTGSVNLTVKTNRGNMTFQLTRATAPCAVESFESLARQKYYDKTPCHRLVTSGIFVLQCGDPLGTGLGGPGYTINDEYTGKENYAQGVIAMAKATAPNTTGGQFFIMSKDSNAGLLPKTYAVVGKVTSGLSVVEKVAAGGAAGTTGDGKPKLPITITSMTVK